MPRRGWLAPVSLLAGALIVTALVVAQQVLVARSDIYRDTPVILGTVDSEDLTPPDPGDDDPQMTPAPNAPAVPIIAPLTTVPPAIALGGGQPSATPSYIRVPKPVLSGPRRVGIQAGHWLTEQAPPEVWQITKQTGTSWQGVKEVDINLDVAKRVKDILEARGVVVDILPTVVPTGYLADAFVSLHGDGDGTGAKSGFKMAYSTRRTPYEQDLLLELKDEYRKATGLDYDAAGVSRNMLGYWNFNWQRYKNATAPHTPSVILEMGFVSNDHDRELMLDRADTVASGIAQGILRFLDDHPRDKLFAQDLVVPAFPAFPPRPTRAP